MGDHGSRHASFPSTNWSEVRRIADADPIAARKAFNEWAGRYWRPLCAYFRSKGNQWHDATELTQGLFVHILENESLRQVEPGTHLRRWLLKMATNYSINEHRKKHAQTRRPVEGLTFLGEMEGSTEAEVPLVSPDDPVAAYHASWRRELLERALAAVRLLCVEQDNEQDLRIFWSYYIEPLAVDPTAETMLKLTWDDIAARHGLDSGKEAARRADWVKRQLKRLVRTEIQGYVRGEAEVADELRDLLS